jgi:hypothetical protein
MGHVVKIALTATLLVAVILFRKPCGAATAKFVNSFDQKDAAPAPPPDLPPGITVRLHGLTEEEQRVAIEKARAEAARLAGDGSGSGSATSGSGSGSQ